MEDGEEREWMQSSIVKFRVVLLGVVTAVEIEGRVSNN